MVTRGSPKPLLRVRILLPLPESQFRKRLVFLIFGRRAVNIIIINGPMGVGKTTVGTHIAETNAGTAFVDGDWCMDIHPFVGNRETKAMAIDNILHMIGNYSRCSACRMVVLVWLMDDAWVRERILNGVSIMKLDVRSVTLICGKDELVRRWKSDHACQWRTDKWLEASLRSLSAFEQMENTIDTSGLSVEQVAETVMRQPLKTPH